MANKSISQLTAAVDGSLAGANVFPGVQTTGIGPVKVSFTQLTNYILSGGTGVTADGGVSSGNVGIGTSSPGDRLVVQNSLANVKARISAGGSASYTASLALGTITRDWEITAGNSSSNYLFSLNYVGTDAARNNIFVATKGGNVGIGTANPGANLEVSNGGAIIGIFNGIGTDARIEYKISGTRYAYSYWDATEFRSFAASGVASTFYAGGTERMRITSAGSVGIGTGATIRAASKFDVQGYGSFGTNAYGFYIGTDATGGQLDAGPNGMSFFAGSTERMRIDSAGNIGIGVAPSAWGSNYRAIDISGGGRLFSFITNGTTGLGFNCFNNNTNWVYQFSTFASRCDLDNSGNFRWFTAPSGTAGSVITFTQSMTLDNSGRLGIGTASPTAALHVTALNNPFDSYGNINVFTSNAASDDLGGAIALGGRNNQGTDPYVFGKIKGAKETGGTWNGYLAFGTTAGTSAVTERMRITSTGLVTFGGVTSSFPALKRSSATLQVRLADDSGDAGLQCGTQTAGGTAFNVNGTGGNSIASITNTTTGTLLQVLNSSANTMMAVTDTTTGTLFSVQTAGGASLMTVNDTTTGTLFAVTNNSSVDVFTVSDAGVTTFTDAGNLVFGTTTGSKIGTATSQKIGFWNAAPIVQPTTAVAAATVAATGAGDVVAASTTFDGYTIPQIVKALRNAGLLA